MNRRRRRLVLASCVILFAWGPVSQAQDKTRPAPPGKAAPTTTQPEKGSPGQPARPGPAATQPAGSGQEAAQPTIQAPAARGVVPKEELPAAVVSEPSQGRPVFIVAGETFYCVMRLAPDIAGNVTFTLQHALEPEIRVRLKAESPPSYVGEYCHILFLVPPGTQTGLYDLEIRTNTATHYSRHCIKVVDAFKTRFRFIHLSNMNIGDPTAPDFDDMLPKEINLLAPEFIIATGDYTEWARALDDPSSWKRVLKYFEMFDAPVFLLCGAQDHQASFTRFVASQPMGPLDYGNYHGLLLLDHPGNPIDQDYDQLQWIQTDLKKNRNKRFNFIATNSDELALLDIWKENGKLDQFIKEHRIRMFITGGSADWDFREFAEKIKGLEDFHYLRTHESSTSLRDRATGFSHYRVIEVDGDQVSYIYPDDNAAEKLEYSIPTGRLRTFFDGVNDGSADHVNVTIQNALDQAFDEVHLWLRVAKGPGEGKPAVAPGRIVQTLDAGKYWACDVAVDVPEKGGVRLTLARSASMLPPPSPVEVGYEGPALWTFTTKQTDFGMTYCASDASARLKLTNSGKTPQACWPVIRMNGGQLHPDRAICPRMPLLLEPGKTLEVPLVLNLRRVSPGKHTLQVYFLEDPLNRLRTFDITLELK
ncbi:MAG TPA: hypothetical protein VMV94_10015 [Phycisphaerae bacterium]|nr:hypothetical protein [Phycisphaerae bacterium]